VVGQQQDRSLGDRRGGFHLADMILRYAVELVAVTALSDEGGLRLRRTSQNFHVDEAYRIPLPNLGRPQRFEPQVTCSSPRNSPCC
jgi:hypothetical protein